MKFRRMNKLVMIATISSGAIIVILTTIFSFVPDSADDASIPILKDQSFAIINRHRESAGIGFITPFNSSFVEDATGNLIGKFGVGYTQINKEPLSTPHGKIFQVVAVYGCSDERSCITAIELAVSEIIKNDKEKLTILNQEAKNLDTQVSVGNRKIALAFNIMT